MTERWTKDRQIEQNLDAEMSAFSLQKQQSQTRERTKTLKALAETGTCGYDINFNLIRNYLLSPKPERTADDLDQFTFTLKNLSDAFGERCVASMYLKWQRTKKNTSSM